MLANFAISRIMFQLDAPQVHSGRWKATDVFLWSNIRRAGNQNGKLSENKSGAKEQGFDEMKNSKFASNLPIGLQAECCLVLVRMVSCT